MAIAAPALNAAKVFGGPIGVIGMVAPIVLETVRIGLDYRADKASRPAGEQEPPKPILKDGVVDVFAGQTGISYANVLVPYLAGAPEITIVDPHLRRSHQIANLVDLLTVLAQANGHARTVVSVITMAEPDEEGRASEQFERLSLAQDMAALDGIELKFEFDSTIHDRWITTSEWDISLGRGLDIWKCPASSLEYFEAKRQEMREINQTFRISYRRLEN